MSTPTTPTPKPEAAKSVGLTRIGQLEADLQKAEAYIARLEAEAVTLFKAHQVAAAAFLGLVAGFVIGVFV